MTTNEIKDAEFEPAGAFSIDTMADQTVADVATVVVLSAIKDGEWRWFSSPHARILMRNLGVDTDKVADGLLSVVIGSTPKEIRLLQWRAAVDMERIVMGKR